MSDATIGIIGLGKMGIGMARNLLDGGYEVCGFDIDPMPRGELDETGGRPLDSAPAVAAASDLFITSLPTPEIVESVLVGDDGAFAAAGDGTIHLEMSTIDPETMLRVGEAAAETGVRSLGSPVSGGPENCIDGTLTIIVGGDRASFEAELPGAVLDRLGGKVYFAGGIDAGHTVKLVNNAISMSNLLIAMEAFSLGVARDVDPAVLFEVLTNAGAGSNQLEKRGPRVLNRNFEPGFTVDFGRKDLRLALETADGMDQPMLVTNLVHDLYTMTSNDGHGDEDAVAVAKLYEALRDVRIEADEPISEFFEGY